jgi:hypothetical protein
MDAPAATPCGESAVEAHLLTCEQCASEIERLRETLALFRETSVAYARNVSAESTATQPRSWIAPARRPLQPAYLVAAAAMLLTAVLLPMQLRRPAEAVPAAVNRTAAPAVSDEALLADIDNDLSKSVPASMQALDDPAGSKDGADAITLQASSVSEESVSENPTEGQN